MAENSNWIDDWSWLAIVAIIASGVYFSSSGKNTDRGNNSSKTGVSAKPDYVPSSNEHQTSFDGRRYQILEAQLLAQCKILDKLDTIMRSQSFAEYPSEKIVGEFGRVSRRHDELETQLASLNWGHIPPLQLRRESLNFHEAALRKLNQEIKIAAEKDQTLVLITLRNLMKRHFARTNSLQSASSLEKKSD